MKQNKLSHKDYLAVAVPFMFSTVTQPLLGAVDTAVIGSLNQAVLIAGVSIGATVFNTIYWLFGFLRVSTTSYSARALGANDEQEVLEALIHPMILALGIGSVLYVCQKLIWMLVMLILGPDQTVQVEAYHYYKILILGAPFVLMNYVVLGWLMGQAKVRVTVAMQIMGNVLNIILDILLVKQFKMGINGVALATLFSQLVVFIWGMIEVSRCINKHKLKQRDIWKLEGVLKKFIGGKDLMFRTLCLLITNNVFMRISTSFGTTVLASNTILLQIESMMAYLFEGLANASSTFVGRAVGEKNTSLLKSIVRRTIEWTIIVTVGSTLCYALFETRIILLFTSLAEVVRGAQTYGKWLLLYPALAGFGLSLYGIFIGMMETKVVRNATFWSMCLFLMCIYLGGVSWGNHGLWISYILFYFGRGIFMLPHLKKVVNR